MRANASLSDVILFLLRAKGSRKNNFTELAHRFRLALFDPKSQNHSNSRTLSRILRLRIGQRWPEDGMLKCEVIFARALRTVNEARAGSP